MNKHWPVSYDDGSIRRQRPPRIVITTTITPHNDTKFSITITVPEGMEVDSFVTLVDMAKKVMDPEGRSGL